MIRSLDARSGKLVAEVAQETTEAEVGAICERAAATAGALEDLGRSGRARMLDEMADALERRRAEVVALADRESALGETRLNGELTRTCTQLRFFGEVVNDGGYLEAIIDHARTTPAGPQPDLRRMLRPLGLTGVFGASNFPLAFSVPGGDTASALAAGCPVVVKAHDAHPATSLACAEALVEGAGRAGAPAGVVSLVFGEPAGVALVRHPATKAVGFTGSLAGGRYLFDLANGRPDPIPFYGELGALNSVVVSPGAAVGRSGEIAAGLAASFTLGVGQFCTKPGLVFLPRGAAGDQLLAALADAVRALRPGHMLTERIADGFASGTAGLRRLPGVRVVAETGGVQVVPETGGSVDRAGVTGQTNGGERAANGERAGWLGAPVLLEADSSALTTPGSPLTDECFGPVTVVTRYGGTEQLLTMLADLPGALTGTIHAGEDEEALARAVLGQFADRTGRLVWDGYPTGVAVTWAMHHGGPYPATTGPLHTSVGATAIRRWLRPLTFQNVPQQFLPEELRDEPAPGYLVPRRVDGRLELTAG